MDEILNIELGDAENKRELIDKVIMDFEKNSGTKLCQDERIIKIIIKHGVLTNDKHDYFWYMVVSSLKKDKLLRDLLCDKHLSRKRMCYLTGSSEKILKIIFEKELMPTNGLIHSRDTIIYDDFFMNMLKKNLNFAKGAKNAPRILISTMNDYCQMNIDKLVKLTSDEFMFKWFEKDPSTEDDIINSLKFIKHILNNCEKIKNNVYDERNQEVPLSFYCYDNPLSLKYLLANGVDPEFDVKTKYTTSSFERLFSELDAKIIPQKIIESMNIMLDYRKNPRKTIIDAIKQTRLRINNVTQIYLYCVLVSDGYYESDHSFFKIAARLPIELQMVLSNRSCGRKEMFITENITHNLNYIFNFL